MGNSKNNKTIWGIIGAVVVAGISYIAREGNIYSLNLRWN